jgi:4'-phosphopantetheinyl transferase
MKRNQDDPSQACIAELRNAVSWIAGADRPTVAFLRDDEQFDTSALVSTLSSEEQLAANTFHVSAEKHHFILRRAFQRIFVAEQIQWKHTLSELPMVHRLDHRTTCGAALDLVMSFSSSKNRYCACASRVETVGIDIELNRQVENLEALAARFFTSSESETLTACPAETRHGLFLKFWTAKEAGLKALGRGIVSGLNTFRLEYQGHSISISGPDERDSRWNWTLEYPPVADDCTIAVVHRRIG